MMYKYRAKKGPEEIIEGVIEAQSEKEAVERISQMGYIPLRLEETQGQVQGAVFSSVSGAVASSVGKIRSAEITIFSRQLASLLKSGVPILASLNIIAEQSDSLHLRNVLRSIHNNVKEGATFSASLAQYPKIFSPFYIAMIRTGENSGVLPEVLLRISEYRRQQEEAVSRVRMAMAYPVLMAITGIGTVVFMLTFVLPRLLNIFINMKQQLPLPTRILISVSFWLRQWWVWVLLVLVIALLRKELKAEAARIPLSRLKLKTPLLGKLTLKSELSRFSRTLELLLKSGIPILKALEVAIPVVNNEVLREKLRFSYKELEQGGSFGRSLRASKVFPLFMCNLIAVGEESGKLGDALVEVAASYERDTEEALKVMMNLLEPLMILAMGLIVGFIVVAMLLPIFEINVIAR